MLRYLIPDALLLDARTLLPGHALVVRGSRVQGVVPAADAPALASLRFVGELWTAAPLLLHAHLESFDAPCLVWPRESFAAWVERLLSWRADDTRLDGPASATESLRELAAGACGYVVAHVAEPGAAGGGPEDPVLPEVAAFPELFVPESDDAEEVLRAVDARPPGAHGGFALHAPFSVSERLARGVFARARGWNVPVSVHLGEHAEERRFLADGDGPLAELFLARDRPLKSERWRSPVDWLQAVGGLRSGTLAVHGGDLRADELRRLHAAGTAVVWCPGTHLYFDRSRPAFAEAGIPAPLLGCDSRASNTALDALREVRLARAMVPEPGPQSWWRSLTDRAAAAAGRRDLGALHADCRARIARFPWNGEQSAADAAAVCDRLTGDPGFRPLGPAFEPGMLVRENGGDAA